MNGTYEVKRTITDRGPQIWSWIRKIWLKETPEERVRQAYACVLFNEFGFEPSQMNEEIDVTGRGTGGARADFVIWRTNEDKADERNPLIIVECKSDNVTISSKDYWQGDSYARFTNARFLITHNTRETKYWRVVHDKMPKNLEEIETVPHNGASEQEITDIISRLKLFKENEFADLLHECHNVIRNREKKDPAAAFDEIAKILFVKVWVERQMRSRQQRTNLFTTEVLDSQLVDNPLDNFFQQTKDYYKADDIFSSDSHIELRPDTGREIVKLLERYNLSDTSEDIKGIAFERFLGSTFRGEIGQFFTPRTIVEFMIRLTDPMEGDVICDPACGSGGFLIRAFEVIREKILADVDKQYQAARAEIEASDLPDVEKATLLLAKFDALQATLAPDQTNSRIWTLANRCIYGVDANDRMAHTSKMNMIMHGDGHGGIHHHDGFLNVNGIFEERFDLILTNPPFGASVKRSVKITQDDVALSNETALRYENTYKQPYRAARARTLAAVGKPLLDIFSLPNQTVDSVKTEILFMERCLNLLKPGGRLCIVLPEGIFNNPSLAYVRRFFEDRGYIRAVISLPQGTFKSAKADVKTSILLLQKFTVDDEVKLDESKRAAEAEILAGHSADTNALQTLEAGIIEAQKNRDSETRKRLKVEFGAKRKALSQIMDAEIQHRTRELFEYPVFLYEAEKVGITSTGDFDQNELYPNDHVPVGIEKTCLELYQEFAADPSAFMLTEGSE